MSSERTRSLSLDEARRLLRNAAVKGSEVSLHARGTAVSMSIDGTVKGSISEMPQPMLVVGCDLERYSGLSDLQQYLIGGLLPIRVRRVELYFGEDATVFAMSGTGDGALLALNTRDPWIGLLFSARLWYEGTGFPFGRNLRVTLARGTCLDGAEFGGATQLQGYGLIETARVMGFDKGRHLLVSIDVWKLLASRDDLSGEAESLGRRIALRRSKTIFQGKAKPGDLHLTGFVNCFGGVYETGRKAWNFGNPREDGLEHPGNRSKRGS